MNQLPVYNILYIPSQRSILGFLNKNIVKPHVSLTKACAIQLGWTINESVAAKVLTDQTLHFLDQGFEFWKNFEINENFTELNFY